MSQRTMMDIICDQNPVIMSPSATVAETCQKMTERQVGAVLVSEDNERLVGIFTGRDAVSRVLALGRSGSDTMVGDIMTVEPNTIQPGRTAIEALRIMQDGGYRHIPVVDDGQIVGIVSRGDFRGLEKARLDEETHIWEVI